VLSVEVRDSPFPPLGFIDLREPRSASRARRAHLLQATASVADERVPPY
jgi:hypothetical protein